MGICELIVFVTYLSSSDGTDFNDYIAKKLAQIYLPINFIDAIFWVFGKLTTKYDTGDTVRGNIMGEDPNVYDANDLDHQQNIGIGTIKKWWDYVLQFFYINLKIIKWNNNYYYK